MQLDSVRILDLSRLLPGPYATQLLADAGADVIKVEDTDRGDYARDIPPTTGRGVGALFESVNRGKRSIALDLKSEAGREAFYELVADADVVFEQFRPGVADQLEIDYETLLEYNDDLVYCSLSGYGGTGPDAERAGHDLNYVGVAGLLDMTREDESMAPQIPGYQIGDLGGGLFAAFSIVGGLLSRALGNGGEYVDVAMTDVVASFSQAVAHEALTGGDPRPGETPLTGTFPWYDVYETADGRYVTLAALEPKFWTTFCEEVDREELIDAHGTDDPAELAAVREKLEALFESRSRDAWLADLSEETMVGPVCTPAEALEHPQLEARGLIERPADAPPRIGFPARGSNVPQTHDESVPEHGEHTDELLASVGYDDAERAALRDAGIIR
ncbi:CaiB/BaiF CoA-transferase family protein [Natrinema pallidum]|uniref:CoA transferase n=1 Tax=Natrinema pallidum TaxID=69527 RepID=A0A4P9TKJ7_9EURY|nr:CaiB/BaiF CoA-transferase family protein [Natrinema pallidum]QCW04622.1 CoA transferase [Natrinema pallidum]